MSSRRIMADPIEEAFRAGAIAALRRRAARQMRLAAEGSTSGPRNAVIRQGEAAVATRIARTLTELANEIEESAP